jgi:predicted nucleic acid-binding protein
LIVLDASAAVAVLLNLGAGAPRIRERMDRADGGLHVPHLFEVEVINTLRRYASSRGFSERRDAELLEDLTTMRITRYPHTALLSRVWELRENVTAYEVTYVALAETLEAPLVTRDEAAGPGARHPRCWGVVPVKAARHTRFQPGDTERRAGRCGEGDDATDARLAVAASRCGL